jgi:hypothetical protein
LIEEVLMRVIVNADDFGKSCEVTEAVSRCFDRGFITNTNMPWAEGAADRASEGGFKDRVGLHLNLTSGVPLTGEIRGCPRFCDPDGSFNAVFHRAMKSRLFLSLRELRAVYIETRAQILRYLDLGFTQMHMDSHHHVHTDAPVWLTVRRLALRYGFRSVRLGRNIFENDEAGSFNRLYKGWLNSSIARSKMAGSDYFGSFADFIYCSEKGFFDSDGERVCEIMVHPQMAGDGSISDDGRSMEEVARRIRDTGYSMIPYR